MTTYCWDGECLAADTMTIQDDDTICLYANKIYRVRGAWVVYAGCANDGENFIEWYRRGADPLDEYPGSIQSGEDDFIAGVLDKDGFWEYDETFYRQKVKGIAAYGSGFRWALAAMDFGCNAKEAIKYAIKRDIRTGGRIQVVRNNL